MARYLLLMRGDQAAFEKLDRAGQAAIVAEHEAWSASLESRGLLRDGDGIAAGGTLLEGGEGKARPSPYLGANQLSGFYLIEAKDGEEALRVARECPALRHGESVELAALGH